MTLASVNDVKTSRAHGLQHAPDRLDRRAGQAQVITHRVDIAAGATEIDLHVDDDERRIGRTELTVEGPGIGGGGDRAHWSDAAAAVPAVMAAFGVIDWCMFGEK